MKARVRRRAKAMDIDCGLRLRRLAPRLSKPGYGVNPHVAFCYYGGRHLEYGRSLHATNPLVLCGAAGYNLGCTCKVVAEALPISAGLQVRDNGGYPPKHRASG